MEDAAFLLSAIDRASMLVLSICRSLYFFIARRETN